jgi:Tol biopolymer transport system component
MAHDENDLVTTDIWLFDIETFETQRLTTLERPSASFTWSPDSKQLLVSKLNSGTPERSIVALDVNLPGVEEALPFDGDMSYAAWYPGNNIKAFVRADISGASVLENILIVDTNGNETPIFSQSFEGRGLGSMALSPDEKQLAFIYDSGTPQLYIADLYSP